MPGFLREPDIPCSKSPLGIHERAVEYLSQGLVRQRFEHDDEGTGEQGTDHFEGGILCGGPYQDDGPPFNMGEKGVLLRFIEAMNFVDEQDSPLAMDRPPLLSRLDDPA